VNMSTEEVSHKKVCMCGRVLLLLTTAELHLSTCRQAGSCPPAGALCDWHGKGVLCPAGWLCDGMCWAGG